jgi:hypothetical protein
MCSVGCKVPPKFILVTHHPRCCCIILWGQRRCGAPAPQEKLTGALQIQGVESHMLRHTKHYFRVAAVWVSLAGSEAAHVAVHACNGPERILLCRRSCRGESRRGMLPVPCAGLAEHRAMAAKSVWAPRAWVGLGGRDTGPAMEHTLTEHMTWPQALCPTSWRCLGRVALSRYAVLLDRDAEDVHQPIT